MLNQIFALCRNVISEGVPLLTHDLVLGYHLTCGVAERLSHVIHALFACIGGFLCFLIGLCSVFSGGGVADYKPYNGENGGGEQHIGVGFRHGIERRLRYRLRFGGTSGGRGGSSLNPCSSGGGFALQDSNALHQVRLLLRGVLYHLQRLYSLHGLLYLEHTRLQTFFAHTEGLRGRGAQTEHGRGDLSGLVQRVPCSCVACRVGDTFLDIAENVFQFSGLLGHFLYLRFQLLTCGALFLGGCHVLVLQRARGNLHRHFLEVFANGLRGCVGGNGIDLSLERGNLLRELSHLGRQLIASRTLLLCLAHSAVLVGHSG